jgi:CRP-like cAMP-binding protein
VPHTKKRFQSPGNRILRALPEADLQRLTPHLTSISLDLRQSVFKAERPIKQVCFPDSGVCSVMSVMRSGAIAEVATVGNEGVLGLVLFFGQNAEPTNAIVQVPGAGRIMPADVFVKEMERKSELHRILGYYAHARMVQVMQTAACNQLHSLERRICKWILMTHDRVAGDDFTLTHEFLGLLLGARRPTVTSIARKLQAGGLIEYRHGRVTVLNRKTLERAACECYETTRDYFEQFLKRLPR